LLADVGDRLVAAEPRQSTIVVAPAQSGKTTAIAIPAILEWPGPVLATSVKSDLLAETLARRAALGNVMVFDPTEATKVSARAHWTPLAACGDWQGARRVARWLVDGAQPRRSGLSDSAPHGRSKRSPRRYAAAATRSTCSPAKPATPPRRSAG
jgi:type IV secretion system protein VirD4